MTNRGLKSVLKERVKFGVDVDAVVVSDGIGYSAESTLRLADIYSFTDNAGLFIGSSVEDPISNQGMILIEFYMIKI